VRDGAGNEAQARAVTRLGQPDLPLLTKSASYEVYPGSPIVYTITLRNPGGATLYDVVVTDPVPEYVLYPTGVTGGGQVENNTTVVWRLPQLSAGETITLSWQGQVATDIPPRQSEIINDVTLEAAGGLRVTAQARSFVRQPRLALNKWATLEAGPGDPVTYTLTVENWGQAPAYDLVIADPIPEYIEGATSISGEVRADEVRLTIATLPAGETATLTWQGQVATDLPGTVSEIVNEATVRDGAGNEAGARAVTRLGQPDLPLLTKAASYEVYPGSPISYVISIHNPGEVAIQDLTVTDPIPDYVLYPENVSGDGQVENNTTVLWRLPPVMLQVKQYPPGRGRWRPTSLPGRVRLLTRLRSRQPAGCG
jgi:uncharacterized repeat protein (TIGR01451 family)